MKAHGYKLLLILICFLGTGCFSALEEDTEEEPSGVTPLTDTAVSRWGGPLLLAHYMPWYKAPTQKANETNGPAYGGHWTGWGVFNPGQSAGGKAPIASQQYPLTGPYDSADVNILEYQAALMKLAGIDGVIFDWYGNKEVMDYGEIHKAAQSMISVLKRAGLKFAVCYEDQTIKHQIDRKLIRGEDALETGKEVFRFLQNHWFYDNAYIRYQGRPVVLCFGPQYFADQSQWEELFSVTKPHPYFMDLDNRTAWAEGSYNWPPMWASEGGVLSINRLQQYLNAFYQGRQKNKPYRAATVFPAFEDIYGAIGGTSYGHLEYDQGNTFVLTFTAALDFDPQVIQIATWNDYGEGTIIEPTIERGYRELEFLQKKQREWNPEFPYTQGDLRIPLELFKLRYLDPNTSKKADIAGAYQGLFAGDLSEFRSAAQRAGVTIDEKDLKPLLRN
jgi:hypothetical protein